MAIFGGDGMPKGSVFYKKNKTEIVFDGKCKLSEILSLADVPIAFQCGGRGVCGKCRVIASGDLSPVCEEELAALSERDIGNGVRLACRAEALGDVEIHVDETEIIGVTENFVNLVPTDPICGEKACICAAVDIGTTTVAVYLYKFPEGKLLEKKCVENPQRRHGADVVSRIEFASKGGALTLKNEIRSCIDEIFASFAARPKYTVVTGNTAMLHFYAGEDSEGMTSYPFNPATLFGEEVGDGVYISPCASAFIGADSICAAESSGLSKCKCALLADIGTNGEMLLYKNDRIFACSTAAGPVFEGYGISCGVPASSGAIDKVYYEKGKLKYTTIGKKTPVGLCGTGVIDAVAAALYCGACDAEGYMEHPFEIGPLKLLQTDVRSVQMAKAAVCAGIETLLKESGTGEEEVEKLYLAGGFGSRLDISNAAFIGLIPQKFAGKTVFLGNAAAAGAAKVLFDRKTKDRLASFAKRTVSVDLAANKYFAERFIDNMKFSNV